MNFMKDFFSLLVCLSHSSVQPNLILPMPSNPKLNIQLLLHVEMNVPISTKRACLLTPVCLLEVVWPLQPYKIRKKCEKRSMILGFFLSKYHKILVWDNEDFTCMLDFANNSKIDWLTTLFGNFTLRIIRNLKENIFTNWRLASQLSRSVLLEFLRWAFSFALI